MKKALMENIKLFVIAGIFFIFAMHIGIKLYASEGVPIKNKVIALDPGHGGWDPGKTGENGEDEKNINLYIAEDVKFLLEQSDAVVVMTRYDDNAVGKNKKSDMSERKKFIEDSEADIMISIHQNSFPSPNASGAQTFYYGTSVDGKRLAEAIQKKLIEKADEKNKRQAKPNAEYYVLKNTKMPSVIVECGFLSNSNEEEKLNTESYRQQIAWAIYAGIIEYFEKE